MITRTGELLTALSGLNPQVFESPMPSAFVEVGGRKLVVVVDEPYPGESRLMDFNKLMLKYRFEENEIDFIYCPAIHIKDTIRTLEDYVQLVDILTPANIEAEQDVVHDVIIGKVVPVPEVSVPEVTEPEIDEPDEPEEQEGMGYCSECGVYHLCEDYDDEEDDEEFEDDEEEEEDLFAEISDKDGVKAVLATLSDDAKNAFRDVIVSPKKIQYPEDYPQLTNDMFSVLYQLVFINKDVALKIMEQY